MLNIEFLRSQNLPHVDPVAGPVQFITPDDVFKSLRRMKNKKAAGPSGVATDMLKAAPDICSKTTADLMNTIIREGNVPADWSDSIIVSLFKGKGDVLDPNKYYRLKLTDQVPKVIEKRVESIIHKTVKIDETQLASASVKKQQIQVLLCTASREVSRETQETVYGICRFGKGL